jgi:hypothetical protein
LVVTGSNLFAVGTAGVFPRWSHPDDKTEPLKIETLDEKTGNPYQFSDKLVGAHVVLLVSRFFTTLRNRENRARFNIWQLFFENQAKLGSADSNAGNSPTTDAGEPLF